MCLSPSDQRSPHQMQQPHPKDAWFGRKVPNANTELFSNNAKPLPTQHPLANVKQKPLITPPDSLTMLRPSVPTTTRGKIYTGPQIKKRADKGHGQCCKSPIRSGNILWKCLKGPPPIFFRKALSSLPISPRENSFPALNLGDSQCPWHISLLCQRWNLQSIS